MGLVACHFGQMTTRRIRLLFLVASLHPFSCAWQLHSGTNGRVATRWLRISIAKPGDGVRLRSGAGADDDVDAVSSEEDADALRLARQRLSSMYSSDAASGGSGGAAGSSRSPVAATAEEGAVDAGACVNAALDDGELELVVDVDVPFLDRTHPRLYDPRRVADFALELAKRVARNKRRAPLKSQNGDEDVRVLTKVFFPSEATAEVARKAWAKDRSVRRLGIVALGFEADDGSAGLTGGRAGEQPSPYASMSVDGVGEVRARMAAQLREGGEGVGGRGVRVAPDTGEGRQEGLEVWGEQQPQRCVDGGYLIVCPASTADVIGTRAVADAGDTRRVPVVVLNPRFDPQSDMAWPRELNTYECCFGLAPFRVQAKRDDPNSPMGPNNNNPLDSPDPTDPNIFRPSVVVLKRHGKPWQLFVDDGLSPKGGGPNYCFCGGFGDGPRRPPLQTLLPAVVEFLGRVSAGNAASAASKDSLAAKMKAKEERDSMERRASSSGEAEGSAGDVEALERLFAAPSVDEANGEEGGVGVSEEDGDFDGGEIDSAAAEAAATVEYLNRIFSKPMVGGDEGGEAPPEEEGAQEKRGGLFGMLGKGRGADEAAAVGDGDGDDVGALPPSAAANVDFLNRVFSLPDSEDAPDDGDGVE